MKKCFVVISLILQTILTAEDAPLTPWKKEMISSIPHAWLSGELLFIKAHECGLSYANQPQALSTPSFLSAPLVHPHFDWNPGFRLNFGLQMKKWIGFLDWTCLQNRAGGFQATDDTTGFFPTLSSANLAATDYVTSASEQWRMNYNIVEVGTSYPLNISHNFILKPHLALKLASIDQKIRAYYGGGYFSDGFDLIVMKSRFLGAGPAIGLMPTFNLTHGFSFVGDFTTSALAGSFLVKTEENYLTQSLSHQSFTNVRISPTLDAKLALNWQKELLYKALLVSVQTGFEWHKLYNQNHFPSEHFSTSNKSLILQGFFISLCIGF